MQRYIVKRLILGFVTFFVTVTLVFLVMRGFTEADPTAIMLPPDGTPEQQEMLKKKFGLDKPLAIQYLLFWKNLARGEFGDSFRYGRPAFELVAERVPATLQLSITTFIIIWTVAITIGVISAVRRDSLFDRFGRQLTLLGLAVPSFVIAMFLILTFGVKWRLLPISGRGGIEHMILPVASMALHGMASLIRLSRSSMIDALKSEYIVMAHIKGVPNRWVILVHAFKNACIPLITILGMVLPGLLFGAVIIETIFAWPGVGRLAVSALFARDYPVTQVIVIFAAALIILSNLVVDILYAYVNPRIRYT
jgi:peptide/nickel transport system permease protein